MNLLTVLADHQGPENAISAKDLTEKLGLSSDRDLRKLLADAENEAPIVATFSGGIYIATCYSDYDAPLHQSLAMLKAWARRASRMRRCRNRHFPQRQMRLY